LCAKAALSNLSLHPKRDAKKTILIFCFIFNELNLRFFQKEVEVKLKKIEIINLTHSKSQQEVGCGYNSRAKVTPVVVAENFDIKNELLRLWKI
jgi:hypothetical protein